MYKLKEFPALVRLHPFHRPLWWQQHLQEHLFTATAGLLGSLLTCLPFTFKRLRGINITCESTHVTHSHTLGYFQSLFKLVCMFSGSWKSSWIKPRTLLLWGDWMNPKRFCWSERDRIPCAAPQGRWSSFRASNPGNVFACNSSCPLATSQRYGKDSSSLMSPVRLLATLF